MRLMPITKKHHHPTKTPPIPHLHQPGSTTLRIHSARLHHQATTIGRIRLHTNDNRSRLFKRISIHSMQGNDRRHRSCRTIRQTRLPPLWPSTESHLRPRPPIHGHRNERTVQKPKHQTKYQHRLPSPDGRPIRTNQPMVGTIPPNIRERSTNRLGQMAPTRPIHTQRLAKRSHRKVPLRTNHGARTLRTCRKDPLPRARSGFQTRPDQSHEASHAASDNACPTDNDKGNQIQTLRRRSEGLARGDSPKNDTPYGQTQPKEIRTLRDNKKTLTRGLSAAHSAAVEDPRHLPHRT